MNVRSALLNLTFLSARKKMRKNAFLRRRRILKARKDVMKKLRRNWMRFNHRQNEFQSSRTIRKNLRKTFFSRNRALMMRRNTPFQMPFRRNFVKRSAVLMTNIVFPAKNIFPKSKMKKTKAAPFQSMKNLQTRAHCFRKRRNATELFYGFQKAGKNLRFLKKARSLSLNFLNGTGVPANRQRRRLNVKIF